MLKKYLQLVKSFRIRKCAKRIFLILALGSVLSLMQAWGSLLLYAVNTHDLFDISRVGTLFESGWKNRIVYGVFGANESNSRGKGPIDEDGYAWWYYSAKYKYGIQTISNGNATMPESVIPWARYNEGFLLQREPPSWSVAYKLPTESEKVRENKSIVAVYELVAGWPLASWYGAAHNSGADGAEMKWSFLWIRQAGGNEIIYPYQPMRGLLANAIVLGVPAYFSGFFLKRGFRKTRACVRQYRGLCPHCAYDITGLTTCPECGQEVIAKAVNKD